MSSLKILPFALSVYTMKLYQIYLLMKDGVCNYCHQVDSMKEQYGTGSEDGKLKLDKIIEEIKLSGKGKSMIVQ